MKTPFIEQRIGLAAEGGTLRLGSLQEDFCRVWAQPGEARSPLKSCGCSELDSNEQQGGRGTDSSSSGDFLPRSLPCICAAAGPVHPSKAWPEELSLPSAKG